ncbi:MULTISPECIES: alpha/beta fold hydrolase [unclassified Ruegeria]|uniref:alpha/beta fold hydrolase n=1 Tax=unclassified Ruegeria TaxID=2625375 RepID=UPI001490F81D|nr:MULTISPECIES: alpha/beta hydrolase [unclassified Ruegeria]NOD90627.1 alpha/beta fold hydrolase [Ruegeria sp. HKCCD4318]NOE15870.1 alpha/beta fold hydrolase [Ruegeria sp. HKCCD4318-2]NOG07856.1 alpha/beta hydrolase [Ruegeria sp. HKCCD4315]
MPVLQTPDGTTLYHEVTGKGDPIVFVHEFGGDYRSWYRQISELSRSFCCITFSARGFLPSDIPSNRSQYGQEQSTGDLLALLDHLNIEAAHLVGTSMGSFTSLDFSLNHPDRVLSVTLVGNSSGPRDADERENYRKTWVGHEIQLREDRGGDGAVAVLEDDTAYQSFQKDDPEGWSTYAANLRDQSPEGAVHVLSTLHWNRRSLFDDVARLKAFDKPVMLVTGDDDYYLVGETNAFLNDVLSDVRWHRFPATGHLVNIERAEAFNNQLAEFVGKQE